MDVFKGSPEVLRFDIGTGPRVRGLTADYTDAAGTGAGRAEVPTAGAPLVNRAPQAAETRRLYATDWQAFVTWCRQHRHTPLSAAPETVAAFLVSHADRPKPAAPGALSRRAAAIADFHCRAGHAVPTTDDAVRAVLRAARQATLSSRKPPPSRPGLKGPASPLPPAFPRAGQAANAREAAQLAVVTACCPGDLAGLRDRALLLLVAAGIDGETLLGLDREHVRLDSQHLELDPATPRPGMQIPLVVRRGTSAATCAVRALDSWLRVSDTRFGPVFRKVDRWGNVEHQRLRADGLRRIWQRRAAPARRARAKPSAAS